MTDKLNSRAATWLVLSCMLANNLTLGFAFGTYGALLLSNESAFGVERDTISFGMSALTTTLGLSALVMGNLVRRLTARISIAIGVAASALAFAGLGLTDNFMVGLAMWALLGFGAAMAAILGPLAIAAEYFPDRAGKTLAMINLPVILFISPWAVTAVLPLLGRTGVYLLLAALLVPVLLLVLRTRVGSALSDQVKSQNAQDVPIGTILKRADFWLISIGIAFIASTGAAYTVHAIPFAQSEGLSVSTSALMLSVYSGAGLLGVPFFGWLADKVGAPKTLAISGAVQASCWAGLALAPSATFLFFSAALGAATTPLTTLHGAAMSQLFNANGAGKAMGYSFAIKLPFMFAASPAVGYAYVIMSKYGPAFLTVALCLVISVIVLLISNLLRRAPLEVS